MRALWGLGRVVNWAGGGGGGLREGGMEASFWWEVVEVVVVPFVSEEGRAEEDVVDRGVVFVGAEFM